MTPLPGPKDMVGRKLGRDGVFALERLLGSGGVGVVYAARDARNDTTVAIKILNPEFVHDSAFVARFMREGKRFGRLRHPNVVSVYALGQDRELDLLYIASEYVDGKDLFDYQKDHGRFQLDEGLRITRAIASGLAAAHERGVVHRDLKPENIMIRSDGEVKVLDFGIAKDLDASTQLTRHGAYVGTPGYSPPEQIRGDEVDGRADIFSLGVMLYEMLTDRAAFGGRDTQEILHATVLLPPIPAPAINQNVVEPVAELITHMTRKKPERRPQSMQVVIEKIDEITESLGL